MTTYPRCIDSIFSALSDSAFLLDVDGKIDRMNPIAQHCFNQLNPGSTLEALADAISWNEASETIARSRDDQRTMISVVRNDAGLAMFEVTCTPVHLGDDQPDAMLIQVANVMGEALMDERYRVLARVFNSITEGVLILDMNGRVTGMNRSAANLLHVREEDVHLEPMGRIFRFRDARMWEDFWKSFKDGERVEINADLELPGDRVLPCSISLSPLEEDRPAHKGFALILKDRSPQIEMQHNLIQMEKLNSLGKLVAGFAHELNNPLTSVIGFAQLLLADRNEARNLQEIEVIHKHALRCKEIIDNLLAFARKSAPAKTEVDINAVITNTADLLGYQLKRSGIRVVLDLDRSAPVVIADPSQMQQVFVNLIENSRYELVHRKGPGEIRMSTHAAENRVVIRIADNGPGFTGETLDRIFDPFFTTKPGGEGTGLGLSLSYGFMQEHGGTLNARNLDSGGAEFEISLPTIASLERSEKGDETADQELQPAFEGGKKKVLIVDDEEQVGHLIENLLAPQGIKVIKAISGCDCIHALQESEVDLILLDIRLPDIDGLKLKDAIVRQWPCYGNRVLLLTGDTIDERVYANATSKDDMDEVITKPFNIHALKSRIFNSLMEKVT